MTRRRVLAIVFGALVAIFVVGAVVTVMVVQDQLIHAVDDDLAVDLDIDLQVFEQFDRIDELGDFTVAVNENATTIVRPDGTVDYAVPAGPALDPFPPPDLPASRIIAHNGDMFTTDGTDGGPRYRVAVGQLDDGRFLAISHPLDNIRDALVALSKSLLLTLLGVVTVLGVVFWLILRASLRPYDDMVDTAEAIAAGDMDRRATASTSNPEIATLAESLNTMLDRLQESFDDKTAVEARLKQFAADASHELRTPLTTIRGYSELYLSGAAVAGDDVDKQMRRINSEASRMGRLVDELLTLARLDQGRGIESRPLDLVPLVRDVVDDALATDPAQRIEVSAVMDDVVVLGDADALRQVMSNLVWNARLHASGSTIALSVDRVADAAVVVVRDDGPGMDADVAAQAFDRFYRADAARQSGTDSSGLGLAIVAAIVDAHGGTVRLDTAPGAGAAFTLTFPIAD
ncbi:MAG: HAMP domain-containing sensor histidine kinase [Ilumatobacteraceae bacterium]